MVIMQLTMSQCEEDLEQDLMHQAGSGYSSGSAGEQQSPGPPARTGGQSAGVCVNRERPVRVMLPCPRCQSMNTKFCYYNNYSVNQPRHFCRNCQRYWTVGGMLRNVPVGGGSRKKNHMRMRTQRCCSTEYNIDDAGPRPAMSLLGTGGLMNMTLPNTLQMETTATQHELQLSMLSQVTGSLGKLGAFSASQLLQSGSMMELLPNTANYLPTFLQFSQLEHGQNDQITAGGGELNMKLNPSTGLTGFQDHHVVLQSTLHGSAMYEQLPSSTTVPNANILQLGATDNHAGFSNHQAAGYYTVPQKLEPGNHIEFLSSMMHKPGYWGA